MIILTQVLGEFNTKIWMVIHMLYLLTPVVWSDLRREARTSPSSGDTLWRSLLLTTNLDPDPGYNEATSSKPDMASYPPLEWLAAQPGKGTASPSDEQAKAVWTEWEHHSVDLCFPHTATAASHCRWSQVRCFRCPVMSPSGYSDGTTFIPTVHKWPALCRPSWNVHPGTSIHLFVDDCLVYHPIKTLEDQLQFHRDLDAMSRRGQLWGMKFDAKKCHIMIITNMSSPSSKFYQLEDIILSHVDSATYIGVLLHKSLSFSGNIQDTTNKCYQWLGFLRRNLRRCPKP